MLRFRVWIRSGDMLPFIGIAFITALTLVCYARMLPTLIRANDRVYAIIVAAEIAVTALATSGMLHGGH